MASSNMLYRTHNKWILHLGRVIFRLVKGMLMAHFAAGALLATSVLAADPASTLRSPDGAEMVLVPAGPFTVGSLDGAPEESPPHRVNWPAFYIDRQEVTVAQYAAFLAATNHPAPPGWTNRQPPAGTLDKPITNIRWADAMRFALWAGKRLPTEAEWEKAARGTDGRRFPWGNADDPARRNKDSGKLRPVGSFPEGASPCGCFDMSGNAWEWTADWFLPYPGTSARSVHFGHDYKVLRGGAGEALYATANSGTTSQRARLVPYGAHDFAGFRCVKDPPGQPPPYAAQALLQEAEALASSILRPPRELIHERQFDAMNSSGQIPIQIAGAPGQTGVVTMGFPLPRGRVGDARQARLVDASGQIRPLATEMLAAWADGSLRWLLLRFPARSEETLSLQITNQVAAPDPLPQPGFTLRTHGTTLHLDTGQLQMELDRTALLQAIHYDGQELCRQLALTLNLGGTGGPKPLHAGPADVFEIESQSPLHADVRWRGRFVDAADAASPMTYDLRLRAEAGSPQVRLWLTVLHAAARQPPWEECKPQVAVTDWRISLAVAAPVQHWIMGGEAGALSIPNNRVVELSQSDDLRYRITVEARQMAQGIRAPGWLAAIGEKAAIKLGVRHFWQNHPISLRASGGALGVGLWSTNTPFLWEGGLAKTHELVLELGPNSSAAPQLELLRGIPPPAWLCGTEAAGALLPRNGEALRQLGYWECWREESLQRWHNAMPTGLRDFGDAYLGGPYKGRNAYANLEYDVALDFLHQFLRTGDQWYFDAAEPMVRHQADIDTENVTGFAWKHSPLHTTTEAELGHVFIRGLLLHHLLTGDRRDREIAGRIGDWIAGSLVQNRGVGNERQIGWSLCALSALHEVTRKPRYLEAAQALCHRLARGQSPAGQFNIRWDNRIAFFNGIALNGLLSVQELAPDPALEQAAWRVAERTLGMYPEYACRTLNAWCWVLGKTGDPRFLHNLERTWISSLEFLMEREATAAETHAWRFPSFAVRYDLFPQMAEKLDDLPHAETWHAQRFKSREVDLFVRAREAAAAPLVLVREGLARGSAELWDAEGHRLPPVAFDDTTRLIQSARITVPADGPWYRLRLASPDAYAWQVQYDRRAAVVLADPKARQLPYLLPRAVGAIAADARAVTLRLEVLGEGFHSATLYDPQGVPVRQVQRFVDFEDPGRYEMVLKAPAAGPRFGWSLGLNGVRIIQIEGFLPYWSTTAEGWFSPEQ